MTRQARSERPPARMVRLRAPARRERRPGALSVSLTALVVAAFMASLLTLPPPERPGPPDLPQLAAQLDARWRTDLLSSRPAYLPEPDAALTTASPPSAMVDATLVSKTVHWDGRHVPYLVPDTALPLRYQVDRRLADRFGLDRVVAAMAQWDGIPGSRWATEFVSVVDLTNRRPRPDGTSTLYLRESCPQHFLGGAFWNSRPGTAHLEVRYGTAALYSSQIDIAICPQGATGESFEAILAHELGHMMGMAHLCEPGEICWRPELADAQHASDGAAADRRCRVMYYRFGPCRAGVVESEHDAARHLYPTLPRLYGPTLGDTSARAAYATTWTHTADRIVIASTEDSPYTAAAAVALAGTLGAPFLLGTPDPVECLTGAVADEVARAAENPATVVLAGTWPDSCEEVLGAWDLRTERIAEIGEPAEVAVTEPLTPHLSVAVADRITAARAQRDEHPDSALLVVADGSPGSVLDAAVAATVAGHRGVPLLYTESAGLSDAVDDWLARHPTIRRVQVMGELSAISNEVLADLVGQGLLVVRIPGDDAVERALRLAERAWSFVPVGEPEAEPVVVGSTASAAEAIVAAGVGTRIGAPLLLTPPQSHGAVVDWLRQRSPRGGYLVGSPDTVPYPVQWAYTAHVQAAEDPAPSRTDAPRLRLGRPLTGHSGS